MTFGQRLVSRYLPPLLLILVTLSVFAILQNKGPRGTMRQFYEAIQSGDDAELYSLMVESAPIKNQPVEMIRSQVEGLIQDGFRPYNLIVTEKPKFTLVIVNFVQPKLSLSMPIAYVLERRDGACKIAAANTIRLQHSP